MSPIVRLTVFKIPDPAVVKQAVEKYNTLSKEALKDGKTYIQTSAGHVTHDDPRSNGYTFMGRAVFASREDMDYYDNECRAHGEIKALLKGKLEGGPPLVLLMDG